MKALQKVSKFLSDYTSVVVIAIAVVTFFVPTMMGWVNHTLCLSIRYPINLPVSLLLSAVIMFSMGLTLNNRGF